MARVLLLLALVSLAFAGRYNDLTYRGVVYAGAASNPWQLPGTLYSDFDFPKNASLKFFFDAGLNLVRVPVLWERLQPALDGPLDETYTSLLDGTVAFITQHNAVAWISLEKDFKYRGQYVNGRNVSYSSFANLWSRLATRYKTNSKVGFGIFNEPPGFGDRGSNASLETFAGNQAAITAIRGAGANSQIIFVNGNGWSGVASWLQNWYGKSNYLTMGNLVDPANNLVFDMHQFLDHNYEASNETCVSGDTNIEGLIEPATTWLRDNGFKGIVGATGFGANQNCYHLASELIGHLYENSDVWLGYAYAGAGWSTPVFKVDPTIATNGTVTLTAPQWTDFLLKWTKNSVPESQLPAAAPPVFKSSFKTGSRLQIRGVSQAGGEFSLEVADPTYGTDYSFGSTQSFDFFYNSGINLVRFPFSWQRAQKTLNGALNEDYLQHLDEAVNYVTGKGQIALIDCHNYFRYGDKTGPIIGSTEVPVSAYVDLWVKLAARYGGNIKVQFGLMNEPFQVVTENVASAQQAVINALRTRNVANVIVVNGNAWSGAHSWTTSNSYGTPNSVAFANLTDPLNRTVIDMHQYLDSDYSGTKYTCPAKNWADVLGKTTNWLKQTGFKAIIGEWGVPPTQECYDNAGNLLQYLNDNKDVWIGQVYWAAGDKWGSYFMGVEPRVRLNGSLVATDVWTDVVSKYAFAQTESTSSTTAGSNKTTPDVTPKPTGSTSFLSFAGATIAVALAIACAF